MFEGMEQPLEYDNKALPFLISIPHGGTLFPKELIDRTVINEYDLFDDSDPFTEEIYDVDFDVLKVIKFDIFRAFVDVNRSEDMIPPEFPDGLIKSKTCYGRPVYKDGLGPDKNLTSDLIRKYYAPFHQKLKIYSNNPAFKLALDCHSMASISPDIASDKGQKRPMFCLGNVDNTSWSLLKRLRYQYERFLIYRKMR